MTRRTTRSGSERAGPGEPASADVVRIPMREIRTNLSNPRKHFDAPELAELAESIRQHGLLQPLLVRPLAEEERRGDGRKYQIVIGARRFFAADQAGLVEIDCYVRGMSSDEATIASFLDHAHHRTLTIAEESEFLRYLRGQRKMRLREIAALLDKSIAYVSRRLGVFESPELARAVEEGRIGQAVAQEVLRAPEQWWPTLIEHAADLTTDQVRAVVARIGGAHPTAEALAGALAAGRRPAARLAARAPGLAARDCHRRDDLREHGPVMHVPPSPAFALLRQVHGWAAGLAAEWSPTPQEVELLDEALELIRRAAARGADSTGSAEPSASEAVAAAQT